MEKGRGNMKIYEVLENKSLLPIKPIQARKPSKTTIKPIKPKSLPTPAQARIQSLKQQADRAKNAVKKEREIQKINKSR